MRCKACNSSLSANHNDELCYICLQAIFETCGDFAFDEENNKLIPLDPVNEDG